jgi:hypothetical protein
MILHRCSATQSSLARQFVCSLMLILKEFIVHFSFSFLFDFLLLSYSSFHNFRPPLVSGYYYFMNSVITIIYYYYCFIISYLNLDLCTHLVLACTGHLFLFLYVYVVFVHCLSAVHCFCFVCPC